jgi:hypothetical protein
MLTLLLACSEATPRPELKASSESAAACYQGEKLIYESSIRWTEVEEFPSSSGSSVYFQDGTQRVMLTGSPSCVFRFNPVEVINRGSK